jgi:membrane protein required for colicin V production
MTIFYHGPMADFLNQSFTSTDPAILKGLSYFLTFVLTYLVLFLLTMLVERWVRAMKLKWLDRLLGAGLGLVKGALICAVLLLGVAIVPVKSVQPDIEASHLAPPILLGVRGLALAIPEEEKARVGQWFDDMKSHAEEQVEEAQQDAVEEAVMRAIESSLEKEAKPAR